MQVIHWGRARKFFQENPSAERALKDWRKAVQKAEWKHFPDVKMTFGSADWVEGKIVFDIKNNEYRLVAIVVFEGGKLYIRHVMTHSEYDKGQWKK